MKRFTRNRSFQTPSLVPLADMLTNTVGVMMFILVFTVLSAAGAVMTHTFPLEQPSDKAKILAVCTGDKVIWLNLDEFEHEARSRSGALQASSMDVWARQYSRLHFEKSGFAVQGQVQFASGNIPKEAEIEISPLGGAGEGKSKIASDYSSFRSKLQSVSPSRAFIYFFVYPDSVAIFEKAKKIAENDKFQTGWYPMGATETITDVTYNPVTSEQGLKIGPQN
jgi:hypothetical protein